MHILEHTIEVERLALIALQLPTPRSVQRGVGEGLPGRSAKGVAAGTNRRVPQTKGG